MKRRPVRYRQTGAQPSKLSVALGLSILLHVALFVVPLTLVYLLRRDPPMVTRIQLVQGADTGALRPDQSAPNPHQGPPPTEKAKGTPDAVPDPEKKKPEEKPKEKPKPVEKKPEEKPEEKPKPEEKKPEEKPKEKPKPEEKKPEEKPKEKPKPEEKKPAEKPKDKPKPEEKKPAEKPKEKTKTEDKKKTEDKPKKKPVVLEESDDSPVDEEMEELESVDTGPVGVEDGMEGLEEVHVAKNVGELTQGSAVEAVDFPSALSYWATLVKRKVDKAWQGKVPPGLSLDGAESKVRVGFWVNRNGELIDDPIVVDGSFDTNLQASCIQAIKDSLPLPPFPDTFTEAEQYITYVFTLTR